MNPQPDIYDKCTQPLLDWMSTARDDDRAELVVRLNDPYALERPGGWFGQGTQEVHQKEQQHISYNMEDLVTFIRELEDEGEARLLDTSWLTHSVLVEASPSAVRALVKREDVDLIDVNTKVGVML